VNAVVLKTLHDFVEKASRLGVLGVVGRKIEKQLANDLKLYFKELREKILALHLEDRQHEPVALRHAIDATMRNVLRKQRSSLQASLELNLAHAYAASTKLKHMHESEFREYSDDQPRDEQGQWTDTGAGTSLADGEIKRWTNALSGEQMTPELNKVADELLAGKPQSELAKQIDKVARKTRSKLSGQITLYRGVGADQGKSLSIGDEHELRVNKMSSWTRNPEVARVYAKNEQGGKVVSIKVKRSAILWKSTGGDFGNQNEYVVLSNGKMKVKVRESESLREAESITPTELDKFGDTAKKAAAWAAEQAAELVVGLDDTTIDLIAGDIERGIEERLGAQGTARLIRQTLDDMSTSRALTIASTEINRAMSAATLDKLSGLGVEYKQWILDADPCEICIANAEQGAIAVDEDFDSGDDAPPAHPNCRCAVAGAQAPKEEL
jgi:SPP1 gp7 family putative phage head morphogenesis protein